MLAVVRVAPPGALVPARQAEVALQAAAAVAAAGAEVCARLHPRERVRVVAAPQNEAVAHQALALENVEHLSDDEGERENAPSTGIKQPA